jgi:hypothetical protein
MAYNDIVEFEKCKNNIFYFVEKYCGFELGEEQRALLVSSRNLVYKRRAVGFTTLALLNFLHTVIFGYNKTLTYATPDMQMTDHVRYQFLKMYDECSFPHKPKIIVNNKDYTKTENNVILKYVDFSLSKIRGYSIDELVIDEFHKVMKSPAIF